MRSPAAGATWAPAKTLSDTGREREGLKDLGHPGETQQREGFKGRKIFSHQVLVFLSPFVATPSARLLCPWRCGAQSLTSKLVPSSGLLGAVPNSWKYQGAFLSKQMLPMLPKAPRFSKKKRISSGLKSSLLACTHRRSQW